MIQKEKLITGLKTFMSKYLDKIADSNPIVSVLKPLASRALNNKINSIKGALDLIAEEDGTIDVNGILTESMDALMKVKPFNFNVPGLGDVLIGDGKIEMEVPFINKNIVFNDSDINYLKELLNTEDHGRNNFERVS